MAPYSITTYVTNAVRLTEVLQILAKHGFADLMRSMGVYNGAPAKILKSLHILKESAGEPKTQGQRFRAALVDLGPTFVKFGQILSTRPDLVGNALSHELEQLQDNVPAVPFDEIRPIIEQALGGTIDELFDAFDETPVAAASLSQVYRATLPTGEDVAVKVQRPGIRDVIEADLSLLEGFAQWADEHVRDWSWIDPIEVIEEFRRSIRRELDFEVERKIIDLFFEKFQDDDRVFIPKTYEQYSSCTVLTMDFVDGVRIDRLEDYPGRASDPVEVAQLGCDVLCRQVAEHRLFHADPHPGNIMLLRNNRIAFIDYGMAGHLSKADVYAMAELFQSIFTRDAEMCVQAALTFTVSGEVEDAAAFERDVGEFIAFEAESIVSEGRVGKGIEQVINLLRRHSLQLAPRFSLLLKALATVESTGRLLNPDLDMVPILRPYVEGVFARRYSTTELIRTARHDVSGLIRLGYETPSNIVGVLRTIRRGKFKMHVTHEELTRFAAVVDRASNRVTFGLITGSLIVGSSLLVTAGERPQTLGVAGYVIAAILGVGILISILRSRNF